MEICKEYLWQTEQNYAFAQYLAVQESGKAKMYSKSSKFNIRLVSNGLVSFLNI